MHFEVFSDFALLEKEMTNGSLILKALKRILQVVLLQRVPVFIDVLYLINLRESSLSYLFDNLVLSDLLLAFFFITDLKLHKGFS